MFSEKQPLVQKTERDQIHKEKSESSHGVRHLLIVPMVVLFYLPIEVTHYIANEWIQHTVVSQQFPNASLHQKTSPCQDKNESYETSTEYKHAERVTSEWLLYNKIAEIVPLIFVNMVLPSYSDTYGRKFVYLISMGGLFIKYALVAVTIYFDLHFVLITIGYGIEGLTGASAAFIGVSLAYVADVTKDNSNRMLGIVAIETAFLLVSVCPAFIAAYMETSGLGYSLSAVICVSFTSIGLIILIFLPESLPKERRVPRKSILGTMKRTVDFYISREFKGQRKFYLLLLMAYAIGSIGTSNRSTTETVYFLDQPFCWNPITFGYYSLARQTLRAVFGTVTLRPMQRCMSSEVILVLSALSSLASYIVEGLARTVLVVYLSSVVGSLSFLSTPLIKGTMSTMTSREKQGSLFASLGVIGEVSTLISDSTTSLVYQATVSFMNSFVFFVMAMFVGIQILLLVIYSCKTTSEKGKVESLHTNP